MIKFSFDKWIVRSCDLRCRLQDFDVRAFFHLKMFESVVKIFAIGRDHVSDVNDSPSSPDNICDKSTLCPSAHALNAANKFQVLLPSARSAVIQISRKTGNQKKTDCSCLGSNSRCRQCKGLGYYFTNEMRDTRTQTER